MLELLTAAQMRFVERSAIDSGDVTGLALMERAGEGVVEAIFEHWPDMTGGPHSAVVLCGPGNNGGDGFVVARLLHQKGWTVSTHLLGNADRLPPDAKANHDRWVAMGECVPLSDRSPGTVKSMPEIVVDALFGTGLVRPIEGDAEFVLGNLDTLRRDSGIRCVAIDIPSGICADSGKAFGCETSVDLTVSFHTEKLGHRLGQAERHCGKIVVKDIGLPHDQAETAKPGLVRLTQAPAPSLLSKPAQGQKYTQGHALVLSGEAGRTGAARLAARAALRVGAGLVTLGVPLNAFAEVAAQITALMMVRVPDSDALGELLWDTRMNALCLGPGLGTNDHARSLVDRVLSLKRPAVLDADALTIFEAAPHDLFTLLHENVVLTPHGGEFARLFSDLSEKLKADETRGPGYSKVDAVRDAARRAGCTVLLKGAATVIATPDGRCAVHSAQYDRAAPWLATAGSGDVLAGLIAGLMARGLDPFAACETSAWLHAACALNAGPGLIAEDIPEQLPAVFRLLGVT